MITENHKWVVLYKNGDNKIHGIIYTDMKQVAEHLNMSESTFKRKVRDVGRCQVNGCLAVKMPVVKSKRGSNTDIEENEKESR